MSQTFWATVGTSGFAGTAAPTSARTWAWPVHTLQVRGRNRPIPRPGRGRRLLPPQGTDASKESLQALLQSACQSQLLSRALLGARADLRRRPQQPRPRKMQPTAFGFPMVSSNGGGQNCRQQKGAPAPSQRLAGRLPFHRHCPSLSSLWSHRRSS